MMKCGNDKKIFDRGRLSAYQSLSGMWTPICYHDDDAKTKTECLLSEEQCKEVCRIVNHYHKRKGEFLKMLTGIRDAVEAQKDSIPVEYHTAIDLVLLLCDSKLTELLWADGKDYSAE